jgi:hypothetical protein
MPNKLFEKIKQHRQEKKAARQTIAQDGPVSPPATPQHPQSTDGLDARRKEKMKLRDARRKERDVRRAQLEKRREKLDEKRPDEEPKLFGLIHTPPPSPKKKQEKISKEEQDERDSKLGCCHHFVRFLVKLIHVIDTLIGLTCMIYGCFILFGFSEPAMAAVITCLTFGSLMLCEYKLLQMKCTLICVALMLTCHVFFSSVTSIMGAIGFFTSVCRRCGLTLSAWSAPFIAFFYILIIVALLGSPDVYFDYLTKNQSVLYLTDEMIQSIRTLMPVVYIVCTCLAVVETCRFCVLRKLRRDLLRYDDANRHIAERSKQYEQDSKRTNLTVPLLEDDSTIRTRYTENPSWVV